MGCVSPWRQATLATGTCAPAHGLMPPARRPPALDCGVKGRGSRSRPLEWPTDEPWPGAMVRRPADPLATGNPRVRYTRAQVERLLERDRERRRKRPWLKPLREGTPEDVMLQLAKDRAASDRVALNYDLTRPVTLYEFCAERDGRACQICRQLDRRAWRPWVWRPPIPVHPGCRCRYAHRHPPVCGSAPF